MIQRFIIGGWQRDFFFDRHFFLDVKLKNNMTISVIQFTMATETTESKGQEFPHSRQKRWGSSGHTVCFSLLTKLGQFLFHSQQLQTLFEHKEKNFRAKKSWYLSSVSDT